MKHAWNRLLETLLWIRFGQELGTDSDLAQNVAAGVDWGIRIVSQILG
jgi:hypothetical protein